MGSNDRTQEAGDTVYFTDPYKELMTVKIMSFKGDYIVIVGDDGGYRFLLAKEALGWNTMADAWVTEMAVEHPDFRKHLK